VAQETLSIWCSLASRLGVWAIKAELEDLCFAILQVLHCKKGVPFVRSGHAEQRPPLLHQAAGAALPI